MSGPRYRRQGGFILLVALIILFALASLVLSLGRSARADGQASANAVATYEAAAVERAAEQYVLSILTDNFDGLADLTEADFARVPVGKGMFWIIRPDYLDADLPQFGLVDESSKINLNKPEANALMDALEALPDMTEDIAASIIDWRDEDDTPTENGAESSVYLGQNPPYRAANVPFENVEELLLVRGVTRQLLYGEVGTGIGGATSSQLGSDAVYLNGWHDFLTCVSTTAGAQANSANEVGRINVNQAPLAVLKTLSTDLNDDDLNRVIAARRTAVLEDPTAIEWFEEALGNKFSNAIRSKVTGQGRQFSADIVAVSGNGRAFKRCRIIVDTMQTPAQIIYRRDLTDGGFPLDPSILQQLRSGGGTANGNSNMQFGGGF